MARGKRGGGGREDRVAGGYGGAGKGVSQSEGRAVEEAVELEGAGF